MLEEVIDRVPRTGNLRAQGLAITITGLALLLSRERQLGIDTGHGEVLGALAAFLDELEPA